MTLKNGKPSKTKKLTLPAIAAVLFLIYFAGLIFFVNDYTKLKGIFLIIPLILALIFTNYWSLKYKKTQSLQSLPLPEISNKKSNPAGFYHDLLAANALFLILIAAVIVTIPLI